MTNAPKASAVLNLIILSIPAQPTAMLLLLLVHQRIDILVVKITSCEPCPIVHEHLAIAHDLHDVAHLSFYGRTRDEVAVAHGCSDM